MKAALILWAVLCGRELRLSARHAGETALPALFFTLALCLFPFALGTDASRLAAFAPAAVWMTALLSVLIALPRWFQEDELDGTLTQIMLSAVPAELWVLAHYAAQLLLIAVPLLVALPLICLFYALPGAQGVALACALALGLPALIAIGQLLAALVLGAGQGAALRLLIAAPFMVPVLILGVAAGEASDAAAIRMLAGYLVALLALCPWVTAQLLRMAARQ